MSKILYMLYKFEKKYDNLEEKFVFFNTLSCYADQRIDHYACINI